MTQKLEQEKEQKDEDAYAKLIVESYSPSKPERALALAREALTVHPTSPLILHLAALASLVAKRPDRAHAYLKRLGKRYIPMEGDLFLQALAFSMQGKSNSAQQLTDKLGVNSLAQARNLFSGGPILSHWLVHQWYLLKNPAVASPSKGVRRPNSKNASAKLPKKEHTQPKVSEKTQEPKNELQAFPELTKFQPRIPVSFEFKNENAIAFAPENGSDPRKFRLRGELDRLSLLQGFDQLLCLGHLHDIETYWYQVEAVRKVLKQFRGRALLSDEVGLGKTVEAGMALKEYVLRGMADRFLILTPASLVGQWREEMETKFGLICADTNSSLLRSDPKAFWAQPRVIASIATARRKEHFQILTKTAYDLVIVDEAHHLKNRTTQNYKLVDALKKRFLLLLSATPVQNSLVELYNLLTLLKPGIFKTEKEFRTVYMTPGKPRIPANRDRMRDLMREAMIRNTRALVDVGLPPRHASTVRVEGNEEEISLYGRLNDLVREVHAQSQGGHRLALHHLLTAAGSSPAAARDALKRFVSRKPPDPSWNELLDCYEIFPEGAKVAALIELLRTNPLEKKLIFVHHLSTLTMLSETLKSHGIDHVLFQGSLSGPQKDAAIESFRNSINVLLSSESGGEGRNIQFCNTLINFDLPWNPMAIEQRIGRIHRIGQHRDVFIFNLVLAGTIEDHILKILDEKINMFELVVGEAGAILGEIDENADFSEMIFKAWVETTNEERSRAIEALGDKIAGARKQYEAVKELDDQLFGEEFET